MTIVSSPGRHFRHPRLEALGRYVGEEPSAKRLLRNDVLRTRWSETSHHRDPRADLIQGQRGYRAQGDAVEIRYGVVEDAVGEVDTEQTPVLIWDMEEHDAFWRPVVHADLEIATPVGGSDDHGHPLDRLESDLV